MGKTGPCIGHFRYADVISGHPSLVPASIDAVRKWVYQQTLLNGEPVEVVTSVTVNFQVAGQ